MFNLDNVFTCLKDEHLYLLIDLSRLAFMSISKYKTQSSIEGISHKHAIKPLGKMRSLTMLMTIEQEGAENVSAAKIVCQK